MTGNEHNRYDKAYKTLFSHPRMVEDLIKGFVHEQWVEGLDFSTLERVNGSYVSEDLRGREDDIVWKVCWGDETLYVYLLLEFQSSVSRFMAVRMMTYVGLLYQDLIKSDAIEKNAKLPPVLPIVLYNGERRWREPVDIFELVEGIPGGLSRYTPHMRYLLLDEGAFGEQDLSASLENLTSTLFRMENSGDPEIMLELVQNLLVWLKEPDQDSLRRAFTVWFQRVLFRAKFKEEAPPVEDLEEVSTMLTAKVREWKKGWKAEGLAEGRAEGFEQGRREGIEKGIEKGRIEALQSSLIKLLNKKFGPIENSILQAVESGDKETTERRLEALLEAEKLEDIF